MTARDLQNEIVKDLKALLTNRQYQTPDGGVSAPNVFRQFIPKHEREEEEDPFPYIEVRIAGGTISDSQSAQQVQVFLIIGIYDSRHENIGSDHVMEIIEVIQQHYIEKPLLAGKFTCDTEDHPIQWDLQEEESWPYFFGIMALTFNIPAPNRLPVGNQKVRMLV